MIFISKMENNNFYKNWGSQLVNCLPYKDEDLSSVSRIHILESQMWWYVFVIPVLERWRQVGIWTSLVSQSCLLVDSRSIRDPVPK